MMTDDEAALDDPVGRSLGGRHAHLAGLLGPRAFADLFSCPAVPPPGWEPVFTLRGRQLVPADAAHPDRTLALPSPSPGPTWSNRARTTCPRCSASSPGPSRATDTGAIALYERLGFRTRGPVTFRGFRTPPPTAA
ncbi:hypothetical protein [Streptomyces sp. NPDC047829]|uniref:hypothetical protein n=1 Tax=Streptomyces sp. NPDC047829 TaxID=3154609 RepID=UPI0033EB6BD6